MLLEQGLKWQKLLIVLLDPMRQMTRVKKILMNNGK